MLWLLLRPQPQQPLLSAAGLAVARLSPGRHDHDHGDDYYDGDHLGDDDYDGDGDEDDDGYPASSQVPNANDKDGMVMTMVMAMVMEIMTFTSTLSTLTPQGSVASSRVT